jgi:hypothetical protein
VPYAVVREVDEPGLKYWLGRLNTWHNFDKHRKLHLATGAKSVSVMVESCRIVRFARSS